MGRDALRVPRSLDDMISLHKSLLEETSYGDRVTRQLLTHAILDFESMKIAPNQLESN